jgi:hypothetical protein
LTPPAVRRVPAVTKKNRKPRTPRLTGPAPSGMTHTPTSYRSLTATRPTLSHATSSAGKEGRAHVQHDAIGRPTRRPQPPSSPPSRWFGGGFAHGVLAKCWHRAGKRLGASQGCNGVCAGQSGGGGIRTLGYAGRITSFQDWRLQPDSATPPGAPSLTAADRAGSRGQEVADTLASVVGSRSPRQEEASPSPVYGASLLMTFGVKPIEGSNPSASAAVRLAVPQPNR